MLGRLRDTYLRTTLTTKIIIFSCINAVAIAFIIMQGLGGWDTALITFGVLTCFQLLLLFPRWAVAFLLLAGQVALLSPVSFFYTALIGDSFGSLGSAYYFAIMVLGVSSLVLSIAIFRWGRGRLWLTHLMAFFTLDILGLMVMESLNWTNMLVAPALALLVVLLRSLPWATWIPRRFQRSGLNRKERKLLATAHPGAIAALAGKRGRVLTDARLSDYKPLTSIIETKKMVLGIISLEAPQGLLVSQRSDLKANRVSLIHIIETSDEALSNYMLKEKTEKESHLILVNLSGVEKKVTSMTLTGRGISKNPRKIELKTMSPVGFNRFLGD